MTTTTTTPRDLRLSDVRATLEPLGMTIRRTQDDEYRVNVRGGQESTAYYTTDLVDAQQTGIVMARRALHDTNFRDALRLLWGAQALAVESLVRDTRFTAMDLDDIHALSVRVSRTAAEAVPQLDVLVERATAAYKGFDADQHKRTMDRLSDVIQHANMALSHALALLVNNAAR